MEIKLTEEDATVICKFCERVYFDVFKTLSVDNTEAYAMRDAIYKIWDIIENGEAEI